MTELYQNATYNIELLLYYSTPCWIEPNICLIVKDGLVLEMKEMRPPTICFRYNYFALVPVELEDGKEIDYLIANWTTLGDCNDRYV